MLLVQILLNLNRHRFPDPQPQLLKTDGRIGPGTIGAIERFETLVMKQPESDGMLVPGMPPSVPCWRDSRQDRPRKSWRS